ncbi:MAG: SPOR domain-containing protein [Gemmatimonadota bacterium]|nr:SPOR domain-containing protein [Gemmatimonadota bacterium]
MRTPLAVALVLVAAACSRDKSGTPALSDAPSAASRTRGPDLLVLRFPLTGGAARAYVYPRLDSAIWTSASRVPPVERVLGFDPSAGSVAVVDPKGAALRVDLRLNTIERTGGAKLAHLSSDDGSAVFGISADGKVHRYAPNDSGWVFKPPAAARDIFPQPNGSLLVLADRGAQTTIWHLRPPLNTITDSVVVPKAGRVIGTQVGGLYLTVDDELIGMRSRDLKRIISTRLPRPAKSLVTTPSGDRIYVATEGSAQLLVIDRYNGSIDTKIDLPGETSDLRMDATGRYVMARPAHGDSAWVIAVGTDKRIGTVQTAWRTDLPTVLSDGSLVLLQGDAVVFAEGETLRPKMRVAGGKQDAWLFVTWNGFRQQSEVNSPLTVRGDSAAIDSAAKANNPFSGQVPGHDSAVTTTDTTEKAAVKDTTRGPTGFIVQFAAVQNEQTAKDIAKAVAATSDGVRVVSTVRDGITIFRVVIGPYTSRADADRVAKASGRSFWIYEGAP